MVARWAFSKIWIEVYGLRHRVEAFGVLDTLFFSHRSSLDRDGVAFHHHR